MLFAPLLRTWITGLLFFKLGDPGKEVNFLLLDLLRIGRFNHKLTLEDICNEVLGDSELDPSVNKALDRWVFNLRVKKNIFPTYRPIPKEEGRVRGNKNIFKVGLT